MGIPKPGNRPVALARAGDNPDDDYAKRARRLGLPFAPEVRLDTGADVDMAAIRRGSFARSPGAAGVAFVAPEDETLPEIAHWLARYPAARQRLCVATPMAIRSALIHAGAARFAVNAINRLAILYPDLSARRVITPRQVAVGLSLAAAITVAFRVAAVPTVVLLNLIGAVFFFGVSVLRFIAAGFVSGRAPRDADVETDAAPPDLPVYTILVPLLHEAHLVADLVAALGRLDWSRDRLDIKLIVEADDPATIAAVRTWAPGPPFEIIVVPEGPPRTKPKARSFALPFARGDFVTVYDAEDQPHPRQLRQAYATFMRSPHEIACLQATLAVDNADASLSRACSRSSIRPCSTGCCRRSPPSTCRCRSVAPPTIFAARCWWRPADGTRSTLPRMLTWPAPGALRLPLGDHRPADARRSAGDHAVVDAPAYPLVQGMDAPCQGNPKPSFINILW